MSGIVYLVQPEILLETDKYKIGLSKDNNLSRIKSYGKNTRIIIIRECENPYLIEKEIKKSFNSKFKLIKGEEWFEGDKTNMLKEFENIINLFKDEVKDEVKDENKKKNNKQEIKEKIDKLPFLNDLAKTISSNPELITLCKNPISYLQPLYLFFAKEILNFLIVNKETNIAYGKIIEGTKVIYINNKINKIISKYMINLELINHILECNNDQEFEWNFIDHVNRDNLISAISYFFPSSPIKGNFKLFKKMIEDISTYVLKLNNNDL